MRYIGNKTKLLPAIESLLESRGVAPGSTLLDVFAGTASVARRMKTLGYRVIANDIMACSAVAARATIGVAGPPELASLVSRAPFRKFLATTAGRAAVERVAAPATCEGEALALRAALAYLNERAPEREGVIARQYSESGPGERRFFRAETGRRIDGAIALLREWRGNGWVTAVERDVLLAALIDAADRVANISGTYGAFLKTWQPNALGPLALRAPAIVPGPPGRVFRRDGNELVREVECDVLYVDPPYNRRQYPKNYHVLEVIAELPDVRDEARFEAAIYGKSGLLPYEDRLSDYCVGPRRGKPSPCARAFADLVAGARAEHLVISYSEEGILSLDEIASALAAACGRDGFDLERDHLRIAYKRFRSDADRGAARTYRVLEGHAKDEVSEWLFYARKRGARSKARARAG
jgi:adenine-specific DNA-methyltransferase